MIADFSFSLVVQFLFLIQVWYTVVSFIFTLSYLFIFQSYLVSMVPSTTLSTILSIVHLSLLYSLYSFEYKWCNMGMELNSRLSIIENCWPYFLGFGLPLAVITSLPDSFIIRLVIYQFICNENMFICNCWTTLYLIFIYIVFSGCLFSILFPMFIISANEVTPSKIRVFRYVGFFKNKFQYHT